MLILRHLASFSAHLFIALCKHVSILRPVLKNPADRFPPVPPKMSDYLLSTTVWEVTCMNCVHTLLIITLCSMATRAHVVLREEAFVWPRLFTKMMVRHLLPVLTLPSCPYQGLCEFFKRNTKQVGERPGKGPMCISVPLNSTKGLTRVLCASRSESY